MIGGTCLSYGWYSHKWEYYSGDGSMFCVQVRYTMRDGGKKQFRQFRKDDKGRWITGLPSKEEGRLRPLYGLANVAHAMTVYVVEGEKCAEALRWIGLAAVTSLNGATSAKCTDWSPLAGKRVVILPDNDSSGFEYAEKVSKILQGVWPRVSSLEISELEELGPGQDAFDWLNRDVELVSTNGLAWEPMGARKIFLEAVKSGSRPLPTSLGRVGSRAKLGSNAIKPPGKLEECVKFLLRELADGPLPFAEIESRAGKRWGLSLLKKAKKLAGVESRQLGFRGPHYWAIGPTHRELVRVERAA